MIYVLLFKYGGGQDYAFASLPDASAQKKCAQVLFHSAWTDAQLGCDLFITATLY
jgi:hypothetical protein